MFEPDWMVWEFERRQSTVFWLFMSETLKELWNCTAFWAATSDGSVVGKLRVRRRCRQHHQWNRGQSHEITQFSEAGVVHCVFSVDMHNCRKCIHSLLLMFWEGVYSCCMLCKYRIACDQFCGWLVIYFSHKISKRKFCTKAAEQIKIIHFWVRFSWWRVKN